MTESQTAIPRQKQQPQDRLKALMKAVEAKERALEARRKEATTNKEDKEGEKRKQERQH